MKRFFLGFILFLFAILQTQGQIISIRGTVKDSSDGSPVPGAVVRVCGESTFVVSDINGNFDIECREDAELEVSFLGKATQRIALQGKRDIVILLSSDMSQLDEVFVVGYGTSTKEAFTGSAETIKAGKLRDRAASNVSKALDGQVAGVMTTSGTGQPGSSSSIRIRGYGSINASGAPLIVVDGIPYSGSLSSINANDIESISVLKDASAGALYGARGANGVVIVTTLRSGSGDDSQNVHFSARLGIASRFLPSYDTLDSGEYMELMRQASLNDLMYTEGYLPSVASSMATKHMARQILGDGNRYNPYDVAVENLFDGNGKIVPDAKERWAENWLNEASERLPLRQEYNIQAMGSSSKGRYMASFGYLNEEGTLATTGFNRFTVRVNTDLHPKKWLDFGVSLNASHSVSDFLGSNGTENTNVWYSAMLMAPIYPVYEKDASGNDVLDANSKRVFDYGSSRPAGAQNNRNSIATLFEDSYSTLSDDIGLRSNVAIHLGAFKLESNVGADNLRTQESIMYNRQSGNAAGSGRLTKEADRSMSVTWNQLLTYNNTFDGNTIDALLGHEFYHLNSRSLIAGRTSFPFDYYDELGMGAMVVMADSQAENHSINSYLSRVNWSYNNRYHLSASLRTDASSRFKKENRWGLFWSLGAACRLSDNIKLKLSYGIQGNDSIGSYYAWQSLYSMNYPNAGRPGAVIDSIENDDVSWERNGNLNFGMDFNVLDGRITGNIELYDRKTTDLLLMTPTAISTGFSGYYSNVGSMVNLGADFTMSAEMVKTSDILFRITLIASSVNNKVLSLTKDGADLTSGIYLVREGLPINTFYIARSAGVDPASGSQLYWAYEKDASGTMIPGSEYITDNQTVAAGCKYLCGNRIPIAYGSLNPEFHWKKLDFSAMLTWSIGGKIYDSTYSSMMEPAFVGQTYHRDILRSWTKPGDVTDVPKVLTTSSTIPNDRYLVDASYMCFKSFSLGWTFDSGARVFLSGDNMLMLSSMRGMDPQASFGGGTGFSYVPARIVSLGFDIDF